MATTTPQSSRQLPSDLLDAIEHGVLTQQQLRELILFEAEALDLDLDFDEVVRCARANTLPRNTTGTDIRLLVSLLAE